MMLKTLFKKQFLEINSYYFINKKTGEKRSKGSIFGYGILFAFVYLSLAFVFVSTADALCPFLVESSLDWLYFALMSLIALMLGVFGSVFNTFASLYKSRDNDLLLSMPIKSKYILLSRMFSTWLMGAFYEALVIIPTIVVYFFNADFSAKKLLFTLICALALSLVILTFSCALGWIVALISSKLKNKSFITVLLSLTFLAAYYFFFSKSYTYIEEILMQAHSVGEKIKSVLYPFYQLGEACTGHINSLLFFFAFSALLTLAVYTVLSKSFIKITTTEKGQIKKAYKEDKFISLNLNKTLLKKELRRFVTSPSYMLNCGLGTVFILAAGIAIFIKKDDINLMLSQIMSSAPFDFKKLLPIAAVFIISMMCSMNDISAPSISLEGKSLWILKSLPVPAEKILFAKVKLHFIITILPALISGFLICLSLNLGMEYIAAICVFSVVFVLFSALFGVTLNLRFPNLEWTNEAVAVKQGISVALAIFGSWIISFVSCAVYYFVQEFLNPFAAILILICVYAAVDLLLIRRLKTKGAKAFTEL